MLARPAQSVWPVALPEDSGSLPTPAATSALPMPVDKHQ